MAPSEGGKHGNDVEMVRSDKECKPMMISDNGEWSVLTRDAAKATMACIDSSPNRVCLQAQMRPKGEESQSEL